jgi:putative membrane protein
MSSRTLARPAFDAAAEDNPRLPAALLLWFVAIWGVLGINPNYREDWVLENLIVFAAIPTLVWAHRRLRLRNASYVALFVFFVLHEVGAHYTYAEVPFDRWAKEWLGVSPDALFGFQRNHYDRLLHFAYGLLATPAAIDIIDARANPTRFWRWMLAVTFIASHSVLYELAEWAAALVFAGDLGMAYLGTQGDVWDAQKDLVLALVGSAATATFVCARRPPT